MSPSPFFLHGEGKFLWAAPPPPLKKNLLAPTFLSLLDRRIYSETSISKISEKKVCQVKVPYTIGKSKAKDYSNALILLLS